MNTSSQQLHPLSSTWPSMPRQTFEKFRDGVIPAPQAVIDALLASEWFQGLKKSQRVLYAGRWHHWLKRGSNQYKTILSTDSPRYRAEEARRLALAAKAQEAQGALHAA